MQLNDRFYTSTEVAEILGVSLRSVYRYLEEGKLTAEVKTATGRHRFTRQNILDFLYPQGDKPAPVEDAKGETVVQIPQPSEATVSAEESTKPDETQSDEAPQPSDQETEVAKEETQPSSEEATPSEEEVDWLAKFKAAAERHKARLAAESAESQPEQPAQPEQPSEAAPQPAAPQESLSSLTDAPVEPETTPEPQQEAVAPETEDTSSTGPFYYSSSISGLKELAQYISKTASKSNIDYAFTMNAGLSLHKLIRPFSTLHIYVNPSDLDFFEKALELSPSNADSAQLVIFLASKKVMDERKEIHGLQVVSDLQLRKDLLDNGEVDLASELDEALNL